MQPTRWAIIAERGPPRSSPSATEHFNGITSWGVNAKGEVNHVYA